MKLLKIKSSFIFHELFSFISEKKKYKLIKYNTFLNKKLELSVIDYKFFFLQTKLQKYNYNKINFFWIQFKNDFKEIFETKENLYELFLNILSKKKDFILKLTDVNFNSMINNAYFNKNIRVEIEGLNTINFEDMKISFVKNKKLTEKATKTIKEIFNLFSKNGKISNDESFEFMNLINEENDDEISNLFYNNINQEGNLLFEGFLNFYFNLFIIKPNVIWENLYSLGYNNFLEKNNLIDLNYIETHLNEVENLNPILSNFLHLINKKIYHLCLNEKINYIFIDFINQKKIFENLKQIEINISNLKMLVEFNIICKNVEKLNFFIDEDDYCFIKNYNNNQGIANNENIIENNQDTNNENIGDNNQEINNDNIEENNLVINNENIIENNQDMDKENIEENNQNINNENENFEENINNNNNENFVENINNNNNENFIENINNNNNENFVENINNNNNENFIENINNNNNENFVENINNSNDGGFGENYQNNNNGNFEENYIFDIKKIFYTFPNISYLKLILLNNINFGNLIINLEDLNLQTLQIFEKNSINLYFKIESKINLITLKILKIDFNYNTFFKFINIIQLPNLEKYQINLNVLNINEIFEENISEFKKFNSDFDFINSFLIKFLKNKQYFSFKKLFNMPFKLKKIKYLKINIGIYSFIYNKKKITKDYFEFNLYDENKFKEYYLNYDLSIDESLFKYNSIKIKGLNKLNKITNENIEIIENKNINLCDINLSLNQNKYFIKSLKDIRTIYCENEIQKTNFFNIEKIKNIINQNGFKKLKYINLTIDYIKESPKDKNLSENHIYNYLIKLIKNSRNLKSLILRLHPNNYKDNVIFFLSLIENLKKLKILKIIQNCNNPKYNFSEEILLEQFPKLKERKYCFDKFIIKNNYIKCIYEINQNQIEKPIKLFNFVKQDYKDYFLYHNQNEEMKKYFDIFIENNKIDIFFDYKFQKEGKYKVIIKCKKPLTNMNNLFQNCFSLTFLNLSNFTFNTFSTLTGIFNRCTSLIFLNLSNFNTKNVIDMRSMFNNCCSLKSLNLSNFNTQNVINMSSMFNKCSSLISLNLFNFNTVNVKDMSYMFNNCYSLISLNLSNFDTKNVIDMNGMFSYCSSLKSLNLSNFNTKKVTDMSYMFSDCSSLKTLNLTNFNTRNVKDFSCIFNELNKNCNVIALDIRLLNELH